jgi:hypothetical protein
LLPFVFLIYRNKKIKKKTKNGTGLSHTIRIIFYRNDFINFERDHKIERHREFLRELSFFKRILRERKRKQDFFSKELSL